MSEDISFSLPDTFIRPFREETDSRNEYKTQVSAVECSAMYCDEINRRKIFAYSCAAVILSHTVIN